MNEETFIIDITEDLELFSQYVMLIVFSFENLLKAKLVEVLPEKISVEESKPGILQFDWGKA